MTNTGRKLRKRHHFQTYLNSDSLEGAWRKEVSWGGAERQVKVFFSFTLCWPHLGCFSKGSWQRLWLFNWLLQIQNVYSALRRSCQPLHGRRLRPVQQRADVQGIGRCRAQVCSFCGAKSGKKNKTKKKQSRLRGTQGAAKKLLAGCGVWVCVIQGSAFSCTSLLTAFDKYHRRNQDPMWLNMAMCQIHNFNTANRLH